MVAVFFLYDMGNPVELMAVLGACTGAKQQIITSKLKFVKVICQLSVNDFFENRRLPCRDLIGT